MPAQTYRQNGCNRGGTEHTLQLVNKLPDRITRSLQMELVDRENGRAAALARLLRERGLGSNIHQTSAPLGSSATVDVYAVDDVDVTTKALEGRLASSLLEAGLLVSAPTIEEVGGVVLGVAATVTPEDTALKREALALLDRIGAITPGRRSSTLMAAHTVHATQMPSVRHAIHDRLTTHSARFLTTGHTDPELVLFDGFTHVPYRVTAVEASKQMPRRSLKQTALQDILPGSTSGDGTEGVVFYERQDPWLYAVLARRVGSRWHLDRAVELPIIGPEPERVAVQVPTFVTD